MAYSNRYRVYYVDHFPIAQFAPIQSMRTQYNPQNVNYAALCADIAEKGLLNPLFADHINGKMCVSVGKQRLIACEDLGITNTPLVFIDTDGMGASNYWHLIPQPILSEEHGQSFFSDDVKFTMGRYVSVTKNIKWRG